MNRFAQVSVLALVVGLALAARSTGSTPELREGDQIGFEDLERIAPYLPEEFWQFRRAFFHEGMALRIGPAFRDYSSPSAYRVPVEASLPRDPSTRKAEAGGPLGRGEAGNPLGPPFPDARCDGSPEAPARLAANFERRWLGAASTADFRATRIPPPPDGEQLTEGIDEPSEVRAVEGTWTRQRLTHRIEPDYRARGGDVFRRDPRHWVDSMSIEQPFRLRGTHAITFRYGHGRHLDRFDDTWLYVPTNRRVERITARHRIEEVLDANLAVEDLFGFNGRAADFTWSCLEPRTLLAPINSTTPTYPRADARDFGPHGASLADDSWELRRTVGLRLAPTSAEHPYSYKEIWLDEETLAPLYAAAFDREGNLWRLFTFAHRWSEDAADLAVPWPGVEEVRSLRHAASVVWNVRDREGVRLEHWDNHPRPPENLSKLRRMIDLPWNKGCR